jgi:DUF4097 and DUF4098 domain-containing protein YvlB
MKAKGLWVTLLVLMIMVTCGLIVSVAGIGVYWFTSVTTGISSPDYIFSRVLEYGGLAQPSIQVERTETKTVALDSAKKLIIDNQYGDVSIQGVDMESDEIFISIYKSVWAQDEEAANQKLDVLTYEIKEEQGNLVLRGSYPPGALREPVWMHFTIEVPADMDISSSSNGNIWVFNIAGEIDLTTSYGEIEVSETRGGKVKVTTSSGNITLQGLNMAEFPLSVSNGFGEVQMENIHAASILFSRASGIVELENIAVEGDIEIENNYNEISFINGKADTINFKTSSGKITLKGITVKTSVKAHTNYGDLDLKGVQAPEYDLFTQNGFINVKDVSQGTIKARTDFGRVELTNLQSVVLDVKTVNGELLISGGLAKGNHNLFTEFGNITLRLPANQSIDFDIKTDFGVINSQFPLTISGSLNEKDIQGKLGEGGGLLTVKTNNGNINIEKLTAEEE